MDDVFKSIKAFLYDRVTSPLFGAFVTAWSIWNYRVISILLSNEKIDKKFAAIDKLFEPFTFTFQEYQLTIYGELIHGAIVPALATAMYIYIYPFLSKPVYEHSLKKQQELRKIKQEEENNRLLSIEESRELYKKIGMLETQIDKETEDYRNQIKSLTETISSLEEQPPTTKSFSYDDIEDNVSEELDKHIKNKIQSLSEGDFQLSDLFSDAIWSGFTSSGKQSIGKRLKKYVERGDFLNIAVKGKGSGNQVIYTKSNEQTKEPINEQLKEIQDLKIKLQDAKSKNNTNKGDTEFEGFLNSGKIGGFISQKDNLLTSSSIPTSEVNNAAEAMAFGLLDYHNSERVKLSKKGKDFLKWVILRENKQP